MLNQLQDFALLWRCRKAELSVINTGKFWVIQLKEQEKSYNNKIFLLEIRKLQSVADKN